MARIAHLTSVHPRSDVRVLVKECQTLARAGHETWLIVADGRGDETIYGVRVHDVGRAPGGRVGRMLIATSRVLRAARRVGADLYHIHDPELLPAACLLAHSGAVVVYDAHEDVPRQIMSKHWIDARVRGWVAAATERVENACVRRISAVVAATPTIERRFARLGIRTATVHNYPRTEELLVDAAWSSRAPEACYVGGVVLARGLPEIVRACGLAQVPLNLAGLRDPGAMDVLRQTEGWSRVRDLGLLDRAGVRALLSRVRIGLVTLLPEPNIVESLPVKMFEYMAAGLPVVASAFPLWREVVEGNDCGICVDPRWPEEIAEALCALIRDDERAQSMGRNGQRAVVDLYNWSVEERRLLNLYGELGAQLA